MNNTRSLTCFLLLCIPGREVPVHSFSLCNLSIYFCTAMYSTILTFLFLVPHYFLLLLFFKSFPLPRSLISYLFSYSRKGISTPYTFPKGSVVKISSDMILQIGLLNRSFSLFSVVLIFPVSF